MDNGIVIVGTTKEDRVKIISFLKQLKETSTTIEAVTRDLTNFAQETERLENADKRTAIYTDKAIEKIIKELNLLRKGMGEVQNTAPKTIATLQLAIQRAEKESRSVA